ncbi:NADP-dependent oxidoreductase [Pseudonocardiaceae bacterium YIM PH 21723]|nr:NADP-dependent oxidoreductase [Pseudonocardiaceae bacterium YIM PH 21723]
MRAVGIKEFGGPEVLRVIDLPDPEAGPGEVRVRVHAAAVNPADAFVRSGSWRDFWGPRPDLVVPGLDFAGVIDQVGDGVGWTLGAEVMGVVVPPRGAYAEYQVVPANAVVRIPAGTSLAQAATLPMNGLTARIALDLLALQPGQILAVPGAAGVLGGYTIGLAKQAGLVVIADAKPQDEQRVRNAGADIVVPRTDDFAARVREIVSTGADGLVDAANLQRPALNAVRDGGRFAASRQPTFETERDITLFEFTVRDYLPGGYRLDDLRVLAEEKKLNLDVAAIYPMDQATLAHQHLDQGGIRGRLILEFAS